MSILCQFALLMRCTAIVKPICCYSKLDSIMFTSKDVDDAIRKLKNKKGKKEYLYSASLCQILSTSL